MFVLYKDFFKGWCITPETNYHATVRDANAVTCLHLDNDNFAFAIDTAVRAGFPLDKIKMVVRGSDKLIKSKEAGTFVHCK